MRINANDLREHLLPNGWKNYATRMTSGMIISIKTRGIEFRVTKHDTVIYEGDDIDIAVEFYNGYDVEVVIVDKVKDIHKRYK